MNKLNWIFTLSSISVLLVTIERFSFTGKVLLQPYNFIRLHEIVQMVVLILITVVIPVFLLYEVTEKFKTLNNKRGFVLLTLFITGIYFYSTGNGVHEMASFLFNTYCNTKNIMGNLCNGLFVNDYYLGNIFYFIGGFLMVYTILLFEKDNPNKNFSRKNLPLLIINAVFYALAIFAYAAFDVVLVGLVYSVITTIAVSLIFIRVRKNYLSYPVITYTTLTYFIGTLAAVVVRLLH